MNYDLVICGVGGQGVLSIAWIIDQAAVEAGFHIKQPEVHGMAQRGGAVSAFVRISDAPIASDLVPDGAASMVLSVEPMESLRYAQDAAPRRLDRHRRHAAEERGRLPGHERGSSTCCSRLPRLIAVDAARARAPGGHGQGAQHGDAGRRGVAAAACRPPLLEKHLRALFADKGERIVAANVDAFRMGDAAGRFTVALVAGGVAAGVVARVVPRLGFEPRPVAPTWPPPGSNGCAAPAARAAAARIFDSTEILALDAGRAALFA